MAINAATDWEIRQDGDDLNGGGFANLDDGTSVDYTLQAAAALSATDLACASNTTLTSATGGFTAAMVGNVVQIASGTNALAGFYQIVAHTDTKTVTIDRTCADGGNMTDGVGKVGGALASLGKMAAQTITVGNTIYVKYSATPYTIANTDVNTSNGPASFGSGANSANCDFVVGYDTTRTRANTDANRPTLKVADSDVTNITVLNNGFNSYARYYNLIIDGNGKVGIRGFEATSNRAQFIRCKAMNCVNYGFCPNIFGDACIFCEADTCNVGFFQSSTGCKCIGCWAHDCTSHGFEGPVPINCLSTGNGGTGFTPNSYAVVSGCIAFGNTGDGFALTYNPAQLIGCLSAFNAKGFACSVQITPIWLHCATYGNTGTAFEGGLRMDSEELDRNPFLCPIKNTAFSYDPDTKKLTHAEDVFTDIASGDATGYRIRITGGTNVNAGTYWIASKTNDKEVVLATQAGDGGGAGTSVVVDYDFTINNVTGGGATLRAAGFQLPGL